MRVLIDAHMLGQRETGNETYVRGLLAGLAANGVTVAAAVEPGYTPEQTSAESPSITWLTLPTKNSWRRLAIDLPRLAREWRADVVHTTYIAPFTSPCPVVVSVHDVSFRRYPEYFSWRDRLLFATLLPRGLRRSAGILALSTHARDEIRHFYPDLLTPPHVVPAAPSAAFRPMDAASLAPVLKQHNLQQPYFLAVGNLQPRKNLPRLVEAFSHFHKTHPGVQLAIAGQSGFRASSIQRTIDDHGLSDSIRFIGYVSEDELVSLYNGALALVYPSIYEGFGLPVVEAMACGRPVIAANTSSLPEVAGDAALLVDPFDVMAFRDAMERVATDHAVAADLSRRALAQAARFSWPRSAEAAMNAFRAASAGRSARSTR